MKKLIIMCLVAILMGTLLILTASTANATIVYFNDFESGVGSEWSNTLTDVTPLGNRTFLGQFGKEIVSLSLDSIDPHNSITVSFDLYVIRSWDGIGNYYGGPDIWNLGVDSGPTLLNTTFSNTEENGNLQSYPDFHGVGEHPAGTDANEIDTLGYNLHGDSVYHLTFTFSHSDSSLKLNFSASGSGLEGIDNESWGIDNVTVIPEPATLLLLGLGAVMLRRKNNNIFLQRREK